MWTLIAWIFCRKRSNKSNSQSLKALEKRGVHPPLSPSRFQTFATQASLDEERVNKEGKDSQSGSSPHYLSIQNLTLCPLPTWKANLPLKKFHSFLIAFHNPTPNLSLTSWECHPPIVFTILLTDDLLPKGLSLILNLLYKILVLLLGVEVCFQSRQLHLSQI